MPRMNNVNKTAISSTAPANSNYVVTNGTSANLGYINTNSGLTWTTADLSNLDIYSTTSDLKNAYKYDNGLNAFTSVIDYLTEEELIKLLESLQERIQSDSEVMWKNIIKCIIERRHMSEDFCLKYIDYVDNYSSFECQHSQDLKSNQYQRLKTIIIAKKLS